jgi:hypothetical protein
MNKKNNLIFILLFLFILNKNISSFELNKNIRKKINKFIYKNKLSKYNYRYINNWICINNKKAESIYLDLKCGNWEQENQKAKSIEWNEAFEIFKKEYKKIFKKTLEKDNIKLIDINLPYIHTCGPIAYNFNCYKYIKYKFKNISVSGEIHWSGITININKYHNFIKPKVNLKFSYNKALKKVIEIIKNKYIDKSWISEKKSSVVLKTIKYFYSSLNKLLQLKKIDRILFNKLVIVNPNSFLITSENPYYLYDRDKCNELKLAYEFIAIIDQEPYEMMFNVWIDAENGELLGGGEYIPELGIINNPQMPYFSTNNMLRIIYDEKNQKWKKVNFSCNLPKIVYENEKILDKPYIRKDFYKSKYNSIKLSNWQRNIRKAFLIFSN